MDYFAITWTILIQGKGALVGSGPILNGFFFFFLIFFFLRFFLFSFNFEFIKYIYIYKKKKRKKKRENKMASFQAYLTATLTEL